MLGLADVLGLRLEVSSGLLVVGRGLVDSGGGGVGDVDGSGGASVVIGRVGCGDCVV